MARRHRLLGTLLVALFLNGTALLPAWHDLTGCDHHGGQATSTCAACALANTPCISAATHLAVPTIQILSGPCTPHPVILPQPACERSTDARGPPPAA